MGRFAAVGAMAAWTAGVAACAGGPLRATEDAPTSSTATAPDRPPERVDGPTRGRRAIPKDVAECEALPKPSTDCHWAIQRPVYCGGPVPPPDMFQPGCACVTCSEDTHCSAKPGGRCAVLMTNESCNAARAVCVYPGDPCFDEKAPRCAKGEQCLADGGKAHCGTYVPEPPRP